MASKQKQFFNAKTALLATASVGVFCVLLRYRQQLRRAYFYCSSKWRLTGHDATAALVHYRRIQIIETVQECNQMVQILRRDCQNYRVLGFDCEWIAVNGKPRCVAMLQLATNTGLCCLFRLCCLQHVPKHLRELLEDETIIKVGVAAQDDAKKLSHDFAVGVASTLDLRFMSLMAKHKAEGLAKLSKSLLNVQLDKNWRLVCSNWEAKELTQQQISYAANDALVAVEIFKALSLKLHTSIWQRMRLANSLEPLLQRLEPFYDVRFKDSYFQQGLQQPFLASRFTNLREINQIKQQRKQQRKMSTRAKSLYDNCCLQAPDGELLCSIVRKKAEWYVQQQLGVEVCADPYTVRLNFEPAGRAVGQTGRFYQMPKENQCVVCGKRNEFMRKNVVPREYRKHFPEVMKTHTSHDVVLLCQDCHQLSNISDLKLRQQLAEQCDAPFDNAEQAASKFFELPELKKVKSAARALLYNAEQLPAKRNEELRDTLLQHYKTTQLTRALIEQAAQLSTKVPNEQYAQHGEKVVRKYQSQVGDGLVALEKLWREHFLKTMQPKFLPELWDVNHNANRLEIRASEGRLCEQDRLLVGLDKISMSRVE